MHIFLTPRAVGAYRKAVVHENEWSSPFPFMYHTGFLPEVGVVLLVLADLVMWQSNSLSANEAARASVPFLNARLLR